MRAADAEPALILCFFAAVYLKNASLVGENFEIFEGRGLTLILPAETRTIWLSSYLFRKSLFKVYRSTP